LLQWNSVIGEYYILLHQDVGQTTFTPIRYIRATTPLTTALVTPGGLYSVSQTTLNGIPIPPLYIQLWTNNLVRISWASTFPGILQYADSPLGPWTDLNLPVVVEGTDDVVYDVIGSRYRFYRLIP
jgi:hypothetical protein